MRILVNLLPHRAAKRAQRRRDFFAMLGLGAILGVAAILLATGYYQARIAAQNQRNEFIRAENKVLDEKIKKVATLKQEIDALRARQQAVEDLQTERNLSVHLLDELVKQVPEGVHLKTMKQEGEKVTMTGIAQSNERVSELLRNLGNQSVWLKKPELVEIRAEAETTRAGGRPRLFAFTMTALLKRPEANTPAVSAKPTAPAAKP